MAENEEDIKQLILKVKAEGEKAGLYLNKIEKAKVMTIAGQQVITTKAIPM